MFTKEQMKKINEFYSLPIEEQIKIIKNKMNPKKQGIVNLLIAKNFGFMDPGWKFNLGPIPRSQQALKKNTKEYNQYKRMTRNIIKEKNFGRNLSRYECEELILHLKFFLGPKYSYTDVDNLAKLTIDCIKKRIIPDDKKIKKLIAEKIFINKKYYRNKRDLNLLEQTVVRIEIFK